MELNHLEVNLTVNPPTPLEFPIPSVVGYGYFLEPHNNGQPVVSLFEDNFHQESVIFTVITIVTMSSHKIALPR